MQSKENIKIKAMARQLDEYRVLNGLQHIIDSQTDVEDVKLYRVRVAIRNLMKDIKMGKLDKED